MTYRSAPRCPRCQRPLAELGVPEGTAWGCSGCGGVQLDDAAFGHLRRGEYAAALAKGADVSGSVRAPDESKAMACPGCAGSMTRTLLAGVPVDHCVEHGTWFDAMELAAVATEIADRSGSWVTGGSTPAMTDHERRLDALLAEIRRMNDRNERRSDRWQVGIDVLGEVVRRLVTWR